MNRETQETAALLTDLNGKKKIITPLIVGAFFLVCITCLLITVFYRSLEAEIYTERTAYLVEISEQLVSTTNTISSAQWDLASIFSNQLQEKTLASVQELTDFITKEQNSFSQQGLSLLVFDSQGNYYDNLGNRVRWSGSLASINKDSPFRQVEITTLPTTTTTTDEMVFVLRMDHHALLPESNVKLTHVAIVRDMLVFNKTFQVPFFEGQGENFIVTRTGTKVYRGQGASALIGDVYNILKPLEDLTFQYGGSYEQLCQSVASGKSCSMEFLDAEGVHYYITSAPMSTNDWTLVNIVPSDKVSTQMAQFMNKMLFGISAIALIVMAAISVTVFFVVRYRGNQKLMRQQAETNAALQKAAEASEEASRAKTVFLSHMSHDIRTPINGIMGMTDIAIRNMNDPDRLKDCLSKITSASHHLLSLINDVLDMSRIESGKIQLEKNSFCIDSLLDGCCSVISGQTFEKNIDFKTDFTGISQHYLKGDELHLRQILINILGNAVKFTPEGGEIIFTTNETILNDHETQLAFIIRDNGIGMSEEFQQKIFEPFAQAEDNGRSKYQGTGLGMSIVKQLTDLMGGTVSLESAPGKGTTFTIVLNFLIEAASEPEQHTESVEADLSGMRVLLTEDNDLNLEIAQYVLEDCGAVVTTAKNGREALELFSSQPENSFDVILMDVMMPVMDGLEATRAIRLSGKGDAGQIPIVAMTANAYAEDRQIAFDAGMNQHLAKPIEREELIRVLMEMR